MLDRWCDDIEVFVFYSSAQSFNNNKNVTIDLELEPWNFFLSSDTPSVKSLTTWLSSITRQSKEKVIKRTIYEKEKAYRERGKESI